MHMVALIYERMPKNSWFGKVCVGTLVAVVGGLGTLG